MNGKVIEFISCTNDDLLYSECCDYINRLKVPEGYTIDIVSAKEVELFSEAYNEIQYSIEADIRVYINENILIYNKNLLIDIVSLLDNASVGAVCFGELFENTKEMRRDISFLYGYKGNCCILATKKDISFSTEDIDGGIIKETYLSKYYLQDYECVWPQYKAVSFISNHINTECDEDETIIAMLCRRVENGFFFKEYNELINAIKSEAISLTQVRHIVDSYCMYPNETWKKITNAIMSTKYDILIQKINPEPKWNLNWYQCEDVYTDGDVEDEIIAKILDNRENYYSKQYAETKDWATYYHLTHVRRNILNWYPFTGTESVLEIGCGMGAITGLLCEKCKEVTAVEISKQRATATLFRNRNCKNLEIIVGNLNDIEFTKKFDVITLIGVFEYQGKYTNNENPYSDFLQMVKKLLAPNGKLFIAIENKYGLKYWCGAKEDHVGIPFAGINDYKYSNTGVRTFSKNELDKLLKSVGFEHRYFYYPLPDYKLPNSIYSQDSIPNEEDISKVGFYYTHDGSLLAKEKEIYKEVIANGCFDFFSNSFLVECSVEKMNNEERTIKAILSSERIPRYQVGTSISNAGKVYKYALSPEGINHIASVKAYDDVLANSSIERLAVKAEKDSMISTKYVDLLSLETRILDAYRKKDKDEIINLYSDIYEDILRSSEEVTVDENIIYTIGIASNCGKDYGPILKNGFLDMTPQNAFCREDKFVWYDQEWMLPNVPAKYVLYRGIVLIYSRNLWAMDVMNLYEILDCFGMVNLLDDFKVLEQVFIERVLDRDYMLTKMSFEEVDDEAICCNILRLMNNKK